MKNQKRSYQNMWWAGQTYKVATTTDTYLWNNFSILNWIHYCDSSKSIGNENGKMLCTILVNLSGLLYDDMPWFDESVRS